MTTASLNCDCKVLSAPLSSVHSKVPHRRHRRRRQRQCDVTVAHGSGIDTTLASRRQAVGAGISACAADLRMWRESGRWIGLGCLLTGWSRGDAGVPDLSHQAHHVIYYSLICAIESLMRASHAELLYATKDSCCGDPTYLKICFECL